MAILDSELEPPEPPPEAPASSRPSQERVQRDSPTEGGLRLSGVGDGVLECNGVVVPPGVQGRCVGRVSFGFVKRSANHPNEGDLVWDQLETHEVS